MRMGRALISVGFEVKAEVARLVVIDGLCDPLRTLAPLRRNSSK